jgi:GTP cyclohydrolase I
MESSHLCIEMRGVRKTGTATLTCYFLDGFQQEDKVRNEFLGFIGASKA